MAVIDGWGRLYVALVLVWFIVGLDGPPVLWLFVFTEGAGAVAQLRAAYGRHRIMGAVPASGSVP
mgnify:CR=1 FL=1